MSVFHSRLQELKKESGLTQGKIAEDLEITPQQLSYIFNGREPNYDLLKKIAEYFEVSIDYLLGVINTRNINYSNINEELGLSDKSINRIKRLAQYNEEGDIIIPFCSASGDRYHKTIKAYESPQAIMNLLIEYGILNYLTFDFNELLEKKINLETYKDLSDDENFDLIDRELEYLEEQYQYALWKAQQRISRIFHKIAKNQWDKNIDKYGGIDIRNYADIAELLEDSSLVDEDE